MGIGKRIKEARENLNLTQSDLADLIGVTASAITNYEKETSHPKEPVMYKLIEVLKVDANYLFQDCVNIPKKINDVTISEFNQIKKYRDLDSHGKEMVDMVLDIEHKRCVSECKKATSLESNVTAFKKEDSEHLKLNAAHSLPNATEEEIQHDEDIMNDENF